MRFVLAAALLAGCYKPSVASCQLTCAADRSCPDGFACSPANHCIANGETDQCSGLTVDGATSDTVIGPDGKSCDFTVSNVSDVMSVCALIGNNATGELDATQSMPILTGKVDDPVFPPAGTFAVSLTEMGVQLVVVFVTKLVVEPGVQIQVNGDRPLVLVSLGDIDIKGEILSIPTTTGGPDCGATPPVATGGGGGGAGYGADGGSGGPYSGVSGPGANGIAANGSPMIVPLRPGCVGVTGGRISTEGAGGAAGGGLELAARGELHVEASGLVRVNGTGGDGNMGLNDGGGGGGSGGSLFLESAMRIVLDSGATLCANGGPGGSTSGSSAPETPATSCTRTPTKATQLGASVFGGDGGAAAATGGGAGQIGTPSTASSGAGGGGSVGRIRLHGPITDSGSNTSPDAVVN